MMMMSADVGEWSQHASPGDVRRRRLLRVGRQLVDMSSLSVSGSEVEQRRGSVWNVATEQDAERGRKTNRLSVVVQQRLPITVPGHQLPTDGATL